MCVKTEACTSTSPMWICLSMANAHRNCSVPSCRVYPTESFKSCYKGGLPGWPRTEAAAVLVYQVSVRATSRFLCLNTLVSSLGAQVQALATVTNVSLEVWGNYE